MNDAITRLQFLKWATVGMGTLFSITGSAEVTKNNKNLQNLFNF